MKFTVVRNSKIHHLIYNNRMTFYLASISDRLIVAFRFTLFVKHGINKAAPKPAIDSNRTLATGVWGLTTGAVKATAKFAGFRISEALRGSSVVFGACNKDKSNEKEEKILHDDVEVRNGVNLDEKSKVCALRGASNLVRSCKIGQLTHLTIIIMTCVPWCVNPINKKVSY